jgi:hypothetical protein
MSENDKRTETALIRFLSGSDFKERASKMKIKKAENYKLSCYTNTT